MHSGAQLYEEVNKIFITTQHIIITHNKPNEVSRTTHTHTFPHSRNVVAAAAFQTKIYIHYIHTYIVYCIIESLCTRRPERPQCRRNVNATEDKR